MLKQMEELIAFQRVTVEVKALRVEEATRGYKKQDITVGDSSETARLMVWESGRRQQVQVMWDSGVEFWGKKFISTLRENSTTERIEDIWDEEEEESDEESSTNDKGCGVQLNDVCVVQVVHLNSYDGCIQK